MNGGRRRTVALYAAVAAAMAALFFFLHWLGNQTPYETARQRLADEMAANAGRADERFFDAARPLFDWEFCKLSLMALAGSRRDVGDNRIADAILLKNFPRAIDPAWNWCAETRAVVAGADYDKRLENTRYWYGNKAALAIGLRWLSVLDFHRLLLFACYAAWILLAAALAAHGWRALAVGAPAIILGLWLSGIAYWADAGNGPAYAWAVLSAAILALLLRRRSAARFAPLFCFIAGMASAFFWFSDGHNAVAVFLIALVAWLGYSRMSADGGAAARRAAGALALWIAGVAVCLALMLAVRSAAAELTGTQVDGADVFAGSLRNRIEQAWAETPMGARGAPVLGCPACVGAEDEFWANLPIARDVRSLWIMTPMREPEDRAVLGFSLAALAAAAALAIWLFRRGERKPALGVLWVAAAAALASVQFFLPTDVDFRNARLVFVPLSAGWVGLALAAAESQRKIAWLPLIILALFAADGTARAQPAHEAALAREIAGERPAVRSDFDVYLNEEGGRLLYRRGDCSEADAAAEFFLHVFPADANDLPERMREAGVERLDFGGAFDFRREGAWMSVSPYEGRCLMARDLPGYPIANIRTGQKAADGDGAKWWAEVAYDMRVPEGEPTARGGIFDLHLDGGRLVYASEDCSEEDARARFFLSATPEDADDLSEESKARGLDYDSLNFDFERHGAVWDVGGCAAAIALPRYKTAAIATGQFVPGEGEVWQVRIADDTPIPEGDPTARGGPFDIYMEGNRLIYAAEDCSPDDTRGRIFLSVFPEDADDLSPDSKARGLGHNALNFTFGGSGSVWDGDCAAAAILPDYAIEAIETGQYVEGEGDLWKVRIEVGD